MAKKVCFKVFRTKKHPYFYDRHTNALVRINEEEYEDLKAIEDGKKQIEDSDVVRHYREQGLFHDNTVQIIMHPATQVVEQYLETRLKQLVLQVTQQCNLRCSYCAYSGAYNNTRTHANNRMSWDIAKRSIDFLLERSREESFIIIGFYGGEPLLEFDLIKRCVLYVRSQVEGKRVIFNMTTNGTLLKDDVATFLAENEFFISISLDGGKEEHDINRKYYNGEGSFDSIINNIRCIVQHHPDLGRRLSIMTTINPYMNLGCVLEYFHTEDIFADKSIIFNTVNEHNLNHKLNYDKEYYSIRSYEYIKMLLCLAGKIDMQYLSPLYQRTQQDIKRKIRMLKDRKELPASTHHGGPCIPAVHRLFVRYDGAFFPCERVNETNTYFQIGSVDRGFELDKIQRLMNIGDLSGEDCKDCWCLRFCNICSGNIEIRGEPTQDDKRKACDISKRQTEFDLYQIAVLSEYDYGNREE